jgi:two-component system, NarL family, response regulator YdfI
MVDIIVGAFQAKVRASLRRQLTAGGLGAAAEIESPAGLDASVTGLPQPLLLSGVRWPEIAPFLGISLGCGIPAALLLEEEPLDAAHPAFARGAAALLPWPIASAPLSHALAALGQGLRVLPAAPPAEAVATLRHAARGAVLRPTGHLSARERALLELVAAGLGNKAIARSLGLSINTVKYHLASIFAKLDARSRAEAVSAAARRGELML